MNFSNAQDFFEYLNTGNFSSWHIITVNERLSYHLQKEFEKNSYQEIEKKPGNYSSVKVIPRPSIFSLEKYFHKIYQSLVQQGKVIPQRRLKDWEARLVFEQCPSIKKSGLSSTVMEQAYQAYLLIERYHVSKKTLTLLHHEPSLQLLIWIQEYAQRCHELNVIDMPKMISSIIENLNQFSELSIEENPFFYFPEDIFFVGFDELIPQHTHFFNSLKKIGMTFHFPRIQRSSSNIQSKVYLTQEQEIQGMLTFALKKIKENPHQTIGCVLPHLFTDREWIQKIYLRLVQEYSEEHTEESESEEQTRLSRLTASTLLNFSAGPCLSDDGFIQHLQRSLEINIELVEYINFSLIVRSPYLPQAQPEKFSRAKFDIFLRNQNSTHFSLNYILKQLERSQYHLQCPVFHQQLKALVKFNQKIKFKKIYPSEWMDLFHEFITILFFHETIASSVPTDIFEKTLSLLDELSGIDELVGKISYKRILGLFKKLCSNTLYQPHSKNAKIQILGMLEASGVMFDHLWIAQLTSENWPHLSKGNMFLPITIQRSYFMPHSSPEKEFKFYEDISHRLLLSADEIYLSYAQEEEKLPSLFFEKYFTSLEVENFSLIPSSWLQRFSSRELERIEDDMAPPLLAGPSFSTGSRVFELQAQCPFKAYAALRLKCDPFSLPQPGISAMLRGRLIHRCLEKIWEQLKNSRQLCALSNEELSECIHQHIHAALDEFKKEYPFVFTNKRSLIEKNRLLKAISLWLEYEKKRKPFQIEALEKEIYLEIKSLKLYLKVDRIDKLNDHHIAIIDYKTGHIEISSWFHERPSHLQLPVYALAYEHDALGALLFAFPKMNEASFKGISVEEHYIPDSILDLKSSLTHKTSLQEQKLVWKKQIEDLATEFSLGQAHVQPQNPNVCKQCDFSGLCRINFNQTQFT